MAAAREVGVKRILTIGIDERSRRAALAAAEALDEVYAAIGHHPNNATGYDDAITAELREQAQHPRCLAIGETGLDDYRDYAPRADQERAFAAQIELAHELRKPLVIHTRAAEDDTIETLATQARGLEVILHCFSMPDRLEECLDHGWWISFAGNVTYPKAADLAEAAARVPLDRLLVENRRAVPHAPSRAQAPQPARLRRPHRALRREAPRDRVRGARGCGGGQRGAATGLVSDLPVQPSLRRLRQFGIAQPRARPETPDRLEPARRHRPRRGARAHRRRARGRRWPRRALRVPRRPYGPRARRRARPAARARPCATRSTPTRTPASTFADAVKLDLAALEPAPDKVVAQPPVRRRRGGHPAHDRGAAGRDDLGGDGAEGGRRAARRRGRLARLRRAVRARATGVRRAGAATGRAERVPSRPERRLRARRPDAPRPGAERALRALVQQGLPHRRKALARSVSLAPGAEAGIRDRVRAALEVMGRPPDARAESLAPEEWRHLHTLLEERC